MRGNKVVWVRDHHKVQPVLRPKFMCYSVEVVWVYTVHSVYSSTSGTGGHQLQGSVPYSSTSGTGGHQLQGSVPYSSTSGRGGHQPSRLSAIQQHQWHGRTPASRLSAIQQHQLRYNLRPHYHHSRLVEKASWNPVDFCREEDMLPCQAVIGLQRVHWASNQSCTT